MARDSAASKDDEILVDGDDALDFAEYDSNAPRAAFAPLSFEQEVKRLQRDLLAAAEHLEYEASVLRQQYEQLAMNQRPKWYH